MPIVVATPEADIRRFQDQGQPGPLIKTLFVLISYHGDQTLHICRLKEERFYLAHDWGAQSLGRWLQHGTVMVEGLAEDSSQEVEVQAGAKEGDNPQSPSHNPASPPAPIP